MAAIGSMETALKNKYRRKAVAKRMLQDGNKERQIMDARQKGEVGTARGGVYDSQDLKHKGFMNAVKNRPESFTPRGQTLGGGSGRPDEDRLNEYPTRRQPRPTPDGSGPLGPRPVTAIPGYGQSKERNRGRFNRQHAHGYDKDYDPKDFPNDPKTAPGFGGRKGDYNRKHVKGIATQSPLVDPTKINSRQQGKRKLKKRLSF